LLPWLPMVLAPFVCYRTT